MFLQLLRQQWISSRALVVAMVVIGFTVPLGSVYYGGDLTALRSFQVSYWLEASRTIGAALPVVALAAGVLLGMATWTADHAGRQVYALSLPLPQWQFVLLRFGAGVVLLSLPVVAVACSALIASASVTLPEGVHAYPVELAARFGFATLVCYAIFFAISTATRRAVLLVFGVIGGVLLADVLLEATGGTAMVVETMFRLLTTWPGPLAILMGRWALFDV
jgi:hypothetical protein